MRKIIFNKLNKKIIYNIIFEYLDIIYNYDESILCKKIIKYYFRLNNIINNDFDNIELFSCILHDNGDIEMLLNEYNQLYIENQFIYINNIKIINKLKNIKIRIINVINNQIDEDKKIYQSLAVFKNLINSNFRRPFNLTEDILCLY